MSEHDTERALLTEMVNAIDAVHMALIFPELGALRDRARAVLARGKVDVAWCDPLTSLMYAGTSETGGLADLMKTDPTDSKGPRAEVWEVPHDRSCKYTP